MSSTVVMALIVNVAVEEAADASLSETLGQLSTRHGEVVWPERVTTAMAELEAATGRLERLVERVSGDAASLGVLAADLPPPAAGRV